MPYRLLCITAHPDDESGAFGGALLTAHRLGAETYLTCLTDGQAAHYRGTAADAAELGRMRRDELVAASEILGVTGHEVLHYPDGDLLRTNMYELIGVLVERIRTLRPHVVITFGGDGNVNLHRDHTIVSMATTAAFHWAARDLYFPEQLTRGLATWTPQKLYYHSTPFVSVRDCPDLTTMPTVPYSLTIDLEGELADRKTEAFALHSSQAGVLERVKDFLEPYKGTERYLLAAARGHIAAHEDTSLFAGVNED